ncbi:hypothetical protein lerEdw1_015849 [Lerista edwardsae]|nr:hypothetical protein lerEdw1_015849 [Lerista edwardsae]
MAGPLSTLALVVMGLRLAAGGMDSCYDAHGRAQRCMPVFENAAFGKPVRMGTRDSSTPCHRCDAREDALSHNATHLTDFHSQEEPTWWQSQSMAFGVQHPSSVNLTLHLGKCKAGLAFRGLRGTGRPESFAIYKRSRDGAPWIPYQYYSASCGKTYGKPDRQYLLPGNDERVAFCTDEFSDISPLSGGNVAFSTLEGRPSAYSFDQSPVLQEWVTATDLLISLNRLNTFGDDIFKDPKRWDFSVGLSPRCKCNGHASQCLPNEEDELVCLCEHNTTGVDCDTCLPFYQDRPWARGTAESANECLPCNCSGRSEECFYDWQLFRRTGHGGHCRNCRDNTDGPRCERCRPNFYRWGAQAACQPCNCNPAGSLSLQCDSSGACDCKPSVTGWKCERCQDGFHSLSEGGCRPCACDAAGSVGPCDSNSGRCPCKAKVEGYQCNRCQPGAFNLQPHNPVGCSSCFCYGHSTVCTAASGYEVHHITSDFGQGVDGWRVEKQSEAEGIEFRGPEKFLGDRRLCYGQLLSVVYCAEGGRTRDPFFPARLILEGDDLFVSASKISAEGSRNGLRCKEHTVTFRLHEAEEEMQPVLTSFHFQRMLSNLTALRIRIGSGHGPGKWSQEPGEGRWCGFDQATAAIVSSAPPPGRCHCLHNTEGPYCERCAGGFHGNPFLGQFNDCKPCPCPGRSPCLALPESGEVVCTQCPAGQRGRLCELCDDGFFGDPLGRNGPVRPCRACECNRNVDLNAVGNCDPVSGRCLRCLYNTTGDRCEHCREGFFGNPLADSPAEKCTPCDCNPRGSAGRLDSCDHVIGQCDCLSHVTGRDCGQCEEGYYDLRPGIGCKRCLCHPVGSKHSSCHPLTGQCVCQPGVEGLSCDRCQANFFGLSFQGCRACSCSRLGSVSLQCYENSTCLCQRGFVGYKCDRCDRNYFLDPESFQCKECPICYGLVKEEADRLKAKLSKMESWLEKPDCGRRTTRYALLGDASRGDGLHSRYLLKGAKAAFLEEVAQLEASLSDSRSRLQNVSGALGCEGRGATKACVLLSDIRSALQSTQHEARLASETLATMEFPPEIPQQPPSWSQEALESRLLARSHEEAAALVEEISRRALLASNHSFLLLQSLVEDKASLEFRRQMEERYQEIWSAQEELRSEVAEQSKSSFAPIRWADPDPAKDLSSVTPLELGSICRPLVEQAGNLTRDAQELERGVSQKAELVANGSLGLRTRLQREVEKTQPLEELWQRANGARALAESSSSNGEAVVAEAKALLASLEGMKKLTARPKGQSAFKRKMAAVQEKGIADVQKKVKQAQRLLGDSASLSTTAQRTTRDAASVANESAKTAQVTLRGAKQEKRHSRQLKARLDLTVAETARQEQESKGRTSQLEEPRQVVMELKNLNQSLQDAQSSLERDIAALNSLLTDLGGLAHTPQTEAALNASRSQLERVKVRLAGSGALGQKLSALRHESEQQLQRIEAFEQDLEEIQNEKQSLEAILRSLPPDCASWE